MKFGTQLILAALSSYVAGHGIVQDLQVADEWYTGWLVYQDVYKSPVPDRIVWKFTGGNGPVEDVTSDAITCNVGAVDGGISASVAAGETVTFYWTDWPESHKGPVMTYMASVSGEFSAATPQDLSYFKIDEDGYDASSDSWASDTLIANNNSWTVTIPSDISAGNYLMRHEILALHSAGTSGGGQFYPLCVSLEVTGGGSAEPEGVKFPGAYSASDPGILVNIYNGLTTYTIPGPTVYGSSGSATAATVATSAAATSTSATSAADTAATTAAGTVADTSASSSAAAYTTSAEAQVSTSVAQAAVDTEYSVEQSTDVTTFQTQYVSNTATAAATTAGATAVTATKASTATATSSGSTSCYTDSAEYNACLDKVNSCIAKAQSPTGGVVDLTTCENERSSCSMC